MGLFSRKKKVTVLEVGAALLPFTLGDENLFPKDLSDSQRLLAITEMTFLCIYIMHSTLGEVFGDDSSEKTKVLDAFYTHLQEEYKSIWNWDTFLELIKKRFSLYEKARNTPHHNGPAWTIGKKFFRILRI